MLEFTAATHTYTLDGVPVPSVTQIIGALFPRRECEKWYLDRGTMTHKAVALLCKGQLVWESLDPRIAGFVRAAVAFLKDANPGTVQPEVAIGHATYRFAGTIDGIADTGLLIDWKTGPVEAVTELQLGGYGVLVRAWDAFARSRGLCAVELREDGTYRHTVYTDTGRARRLFLAALSLYQWGVAAGVIPNAKVRVTE